MSKVAVIGYFLDGKLVSEGQGVKTKILTEELEKILGQNSVLRIDTYGWKKHPIRLLLQSILAVLECKNVIFMTDEGGIRIFPWLLRYANVFRKCKIQYVVIGGWLPHYVEKHPYIEYCLKKIHGIYVETKTMKHKMEVRGFSNLHLMPNFKSLKPIAETELNLTNEGPYKLCTFSRVMREKGIEDAVTAVTAANAYLGKTVFTLDIFGQVDGSQHVWFETLSNHFSPEIRYCGIIPFDQSVETIKSYFALLFPTRFYTEGVPGTIIDAYASGVPVIASEWESYADIISQNETGISYPFMDTDKLKELLIEIANNPERVNSLRTNCLVKSREYLPQKAIGVLVDNL